MNSVLLRARVVKIIRTKKFHELDLILFHPFTISFNVFAAEHFAHVNSTAQLCPDLFKILIRFKNVLICLQVYVQKCTQLLHRAEHLLFWSSLQCYKK